MPMVAQRSDYLAVLRKGGAGIGHGGVLSRLHLYPLAIPRILAPAVRVAAALPDRNFFGSFLENPLRAVEWDLTFQEVPLDVREPIRSGPFVRYNDMLALEFVDAM
jgi:hypothetical protein